MGMLTMPGYNLNYLYKLVKVIQVEVFQSFSYSFEHFFMLSLGMLSLGMLSLGILTLVGGQTPSGQNPLGQNPHTFLHG